MATRYTLIRRCWTLALVLCSTAVAAGPLPALVLDKAQTTVSGLSSGGFMAVQLHIAYSATFGQGAGVVAGGPYDCAEDSVFDATGRCMSHGSPIPVASLVNLTRSWAASGKIDPLDHLARSRLYLFSGSKDSVVAPAVMDDLALYYKSFVPAANTVYKKDIAAEHAFVTDDYGNPCATKGGPYISNCGYDQAGALLQQLYGPLQPRQPGSLGGRLIEFDQWPYVSGHGMADSGWVYVPAACSAGETCRLHVVLHGCQQNAASVGDAVARHAGFNRWADSNRLVVLYPQTGSGAINGCWDWWGYDSPGYAEQSGPQMRAIKAMVDRLGGGADTPEVCIAASNFDHVLAGRAYVFFGWTFAEGSNQSMGLWNIYVRTTLKQTGPKNYRVGACP